VRASDGLAPACTLAGAAEAFTRDVTNLPIAAALRQRQGAAAQPAPSHQQASTLPARPLLLRQEQQHAGLLGRRPPEAIPLAEPQQRPMNRRTSFLAGAKAALLEASAPSSQPGLDSPRAPPQRPQAAAGPRHVAQLTLRRSPLAVLAGLPAVPGAAVQRAAGDSALPAAPRAEATPQGQLCLRPTPAAAQAPPPARTDGGTSILSGGWVSVVCYSVWLGNLSSFAWEADRGGIRTMCTVVDACSCVFLMPAPCRRSR
jgi:hypothetical protein